MTNQPNAQAVKHPDGFLVLGTYALVGRDCSAKEYRSAKQHAQAHGLTVRVADIPTSDLMRPTRPSWKDRIREDMTDE